MKKTTKIGLGAFGIIIALIALWAIISTLLEPKVTFGPDDIKLEWLNNNTLLSSCYVKNNSNKDWEGSVMIYITNLDDDTLSFYTIKDLANKTVKSKQRGWASLKIPFADIKGRYTENTIRIRWTWGTSTVRKAFKL